MADRLILEDGTGFIILEDNSGVLELDNTVAAASPQLLATMTRSTNGADFAVDITAKGGDDYLVPNGNNLSYIRKDIATSLFGVPVSNWSFKDNSGTPSGYLVTGTDGKAPSSASFSVSTIYGGYSDPGQTWVVTVPAGIGVRTLQFVAYAEYGASFIVNAGLSDSSVAPVEINRNAGSGTGDFGFYELDYAAGSPGQTLTITITCDDPGFNIRLGWFWLSSEVSSGFTELAVAASNVVTAAGIINTGILLQGAAVSLGSASANISTGVTFTGAALSLVTASGDIASPTQFFANAQDVATLTGAMTTSIRAAVSAMGVATGTGNISTGINMAGNAQDNVSASGQVNSQIRFVANAADVASASGGLSTGVNLNGFAASIVTVNGNPTMQIRLRADALSQVLASAGFNTGVLFNGDAQGIVNASVALSTTIRAAGNAQGQASASAGLSIGAGLSGNAQDTVVVTVALNTQIRLSGSPQAVSAAVASLSGVATQMQAQAVGVVSASAALTTGAKLTGNAQDVVTAIVNITTQIPLTAAVLAQAISGGQIITNIRLSGFAADDADSSGTLGFAATVTPYSFSTKASSHQAIISHLAPQSLRCNAQATTYIDTEVRLAA